MVDTCEAASLAKLRCSSLSLAATELRHAEVHAQQQPPRDLPYAHKEAGKSELDDLLQWRSCIPLLNAHCTAWPAISTVGMQTQVGTKALARARCHASSRQAATLTESFQQMLLHVAYHLVEPLAQTVIRWE